MAKKNVTLNNHAGMFSAPIKAIEDKTDKRFVLDLKIPGFSADEVSFKALDSGLVKVKGKVLHKNPQYDADGRLDKFGMNGVREAFEVQLMLNTAKYNVRSLKVSTKNGVARVQAMKHGERMISPAERRTMDYGYGYYIRTCPCYGCPGRAYYSPAPSFFTAPTYVVKSGVSQAHAIQ